MFDTKTKTASKCRWRENAIVISSDAAGSTLYYGAGAGSLATASSVTADIVDIGRKILSGSTLSVPLLSYQNYELEKRIF